MRKPSLPHLLALVSCSLTACVAATPTHTATPTEVGATKVSARPSTGTLVAVVDGQSIEFDALRPALIELAGSTALRDAIVDQRLAARLAARGQHLDAQAIERERALLLDALHADRERAMELLGEIRTRQGLGEIRFAALLRRNAGLRALVASSVTMDDEGIENAFDMLHGAKRVARLAVLASLADAERFCSDATQSNFAELASTRSLDESAHRGGLLLPVARRDPSVPQGVRAALFITPVGSISTPTLDGSKFVVLQVLSETPADGVTREASRARCEELLRRSRERLLMDALARELAQESGVTIFDRAFDRAQR